jgi:hypothetical protein
MESLIIYSIIFFIILISLIILYISLNPLEIKDKNIENFYADSDELPPFVPKVLQGLSPDTYIERNVEGSSTEKYILIKKNTVIEFPKDFPNCQILVVGGGGGGGGFGGGGGAGAILFATNYTIPNGTHTILVGNGGVGAPKNTNGTNGNNSLITINGNSFIAVGGGGGGSRNDNDRAIGIAGNNGGSGGGGGHTNVYLSPQTNIGGTSTKNTYTGWTSYGNTGGAGKNGTGGASYATHGSGGGGGAGSAGSNAGINSGGNGGTGINMTNYFGSLVGHNGWFGGGGAGSSYLQNAGTNGYANGGNGNFGGGGNAFSANGLANTGGGGGGAAFNNESGNGGTGGSGVVIIRYKPIKQELPLITERNPTDINLLLNTELNNILTARKPSTLFSNIKRVNTENDYYVQQALIQDAIGIENYTVAYSSYIDDLTSPLRLFSYDNTISNNTGAQFGINRYNKTTGLFITTNSKPLGIKYIQIENNQNVVKDNPNFGDWVFIKFPTSFILVQYGFVANIAFENKAPGDWILFGRDSTASSDNKAYHIIDKATVNSGSSCPDMSCADGRKSWKDYANKESLLNVNLLDNRRKCDEYIFIFTRLAFTDIRNNIKQGHQLHFKEIRMRSRE